jgi:hypothetical protein
MRSIKGGLRHAGWVDWEHPEVAGNVLLAREDNCTIKNNLAFVVIK